MITPSACNFFFLSQASPPHPPPKSSDCLQEGEESRSAVHWLTLGGVGCRAGGRERGRTVKCYRNSWLKRGNGRYRTSSIDTDLSGGKTQLQQKKPAGLRTRCSHNCASIASMRRSNGQMRGERAVCTIRLIKCLINVRLLPIPKVQNYNQRDFIRINLWLSYISFFCLFCFLQSDAPVWEQKCNFFLIILWIKRETRMNDLKIFWQQMAVASV